MIKIENIRHVGEEPKKNEQFKSSRSLQSETDCEITIGLKKFNPNPIYSFKVKRGPGKGKVFARMFRNKLLLVRGKHRSSDPETALKGLYLYQSFAPGIKATSATFNDQ